ncbi:MAG: hypothetical protein H5T69_11735 [Chloroflexi bacterium]|nr:hypothetical protein [Chloroflexota bacterium]
MSKRQVWRPVVAGVVVLAILVGVFSFAPSRALARQLLSVFRVNKFAVVRVSPDQAQLEELGRALEENVFSREPEVIVDEPLVTVSSIEEARALAGFDARLPEYLPFEPGMLKIQVKGRTEYALSVPREALVAVLSLAGMGDRDLPADLQEATVRIAMPAAVQMTAPKFALMQVYEPEVDYPEGIDPSLFGEAGLRLMGLQADEARRISRSIDWTNTLVLPVPDDLTEIRELQIAGEEAVLLQPRTRDDYNMTTLLFEKEGIVYVLSARGSYEMLVQVAESMF